MLHLSSMQNIPWEKIKALENEIKALKKVNKKEIIKKKPKSFYGLIKDAPEITWEEFQEAKRVLFTHSKPIK